MNKKILREISAVMFLTAVAISTFWLFFPSLEAGKFFLSAHITGDHQKEFYQLPYELHGGLNRWWFDLIGWPSLIGLCWGLGRIDTTRESDLKSGISIGFILGFPFALFGGLTSGLLFGFIGSLFFWLDSGNSRYASIILLSAISFSVATSIHGLAGIAFLVTIAILMLTQISIFYGFGVVISWLLAQFKKEKIPG